jgi:hypothetical protein
MSELEPSNELRPVSVWRRLLLGIVALVVILIVVGAIQQFQEGSTSASRLKKFKENLDKSDPNWRLEELEGAREQPPEDDNSSRVIVTATRLLPKEWAKALEEYQQSLPDHGLPPIAQLDGQQQALLNKALQQAAPALGEARKLVGMPRGRHELIFKTNPIGTLLPDAQKAREVAALLQLDGRLRAQNGDIAGALVSCRACLNAGRSFGDEPFLISQLVRIACVTMACGEIQRVLAQGESTDADLAEVQKALALEDRHPTLAVGLRGERAVVDDLLTKMEDGRIPLKEMFSPGLPDMPEGMSWRVWLLGFSKSDIRRDHARLLDIQTGMVEAARLPAHEQLAEQRKIDAEIRSLPRDAILARLLMPGIAKVAEACRRKQAQVRALLVLVAVERYRMKNKTWPDKLDQLKPGLLAEVPLDPYDGKPMRYGKLADGVVVYSIGQNEKDDGGNVDRSAGLPLDEGWRLWDVTSRRGLPMPRPEP